MFQRQILTLGDIKPLEEANICIIGCGGLGCSAALHCALSGIKNITLVDYDKIELSNIHRQICYQQSDIGKNKIDVCKQFIQDRCPDANIIIYKTLPEHFKADVIVECTDSIKSKKEWNEKCKMLKIPYIFGAALQTYGFIGCFNFKNENSSCLKCCFPFFEQAESNCNVKGIWGIVSNLVGTLQACFTVECIINPFFETRAMLCERGKFTNFKCSEVCECNDKAKEELYKVQFSLDLLTDTVLCFDLRENAEKSYDRFIPYIDIDTVMIGCQKFKTVYVCCDRGEKSDEIVRKVREKGIENIYVLDMES